MISDINNGHNDKLNEKIKEYMLDFENLPYGIAVVKNDVYSTIIQANSAYYNMIGYTKEELWEKHQNKVSEILIDRVYTILEQQAQTQTQDYDIELDLRIRTLTGVMRWLRDFAHYDSELDVFFITVTNITDKLIATARHLSYDAFQTRNEILGYLNIYTNEHITITDAITDEVVYINPSASKLLGFTDESDWLGKSYSELAFGSKEDVPDSYYEPVGEDEFTVGEYYNEFHKMYCEVKSKIITVPRLKRKMRLNLITDITPKKNLEHKIELQRTLQNCIESLFTAGVTDKTSKDAYVDILKQLKEYYNADITFFYKFKEKSYEVENFYEVFKDAIQQNTHTLPIIVPENQVKLLKKLSEEKTVNYMDMVNCLNEDEAEALSQWRLAYEMQTFSCIALNNRDGNIIAFMGIINPKYHENDKQLMKLLSRFICMLIEHEQDENLKAEAVNLETISKENLVQKCVKNFQDLTNANESITDTLDALSLHYDADFSIIVLNQDNDLWVPAYIGGKKVPDLSALKNHDNSIMKKWLGELKTNPQFVSDNDFIDLKDLNIEKILDEKFGIYNFIVSPIRDSKDTIIGLLFVNNFKLLNRSHLMVQVVGKCISDYSAKISLYETTLIEPLTKLSNKESAQNRISKILEEEKKGTLFIIDVDDFKKLNDVLGHDLGDEVLIDLSSMLKKIFKNSDVVARVGGDEFMVFCPDLVSNDLIEEKAKQIVERSKLRYKKGEKTVDISTSIGICSVEESCKTFQALYEKADYALYISKKNGKNRYYIYTVAEQLYEYSEIDERKSYHAMVKLLKSAIKDRRFVVQYQPIYHVPTDTFTHAEALVRIAKTDGGLIYPNDFIDVANNTGLVTEMTYQVLEQVCHDFRKLLTQNPDTTLKSIAINVPYLQFIDPNMQNRFIEILKRYDIAPHQIKLEITEQIIIKDLDLMTKTMASMMSQGFDFELDDFGTEYSNLQMCITLPLDIIKLDRSVLLAALASEKGGSFFQYIIAGIHSTDRQIILEGVETKAQLSWAKECNCEYIQGYYFSKPINFESFSEFLQK